MFYISYINDHVTTSDMWSDEEEVTFLTCLISLLWALTDSTCCPTNRPVNWEWLSRRWTQCFISSWFCLSVCRYWPGGNHLKRLQNVWSWRTRLRSQRRVRSQRVITDLQTLAAQRKLILVLFFLFGFADYRNYWWHKQTSSHLRRCRTDPVHLTLIPSELFKVLE